MPSSQLQNEELFFVYFLYSAKVDRYYVGQTDNILRRMCSHTSGQSPYTSIAKDWILMHTESYATRSESLKREKAIKRKKSRKYIEWLITQSASSRQGSG
jgi:putative endonuclease